MKNNQRDIYKNTAMYVICTADQSFPADLP